MAIHVPLYFPDDTAEKMIEKFGSIDDFKKAIKAKAEEMLK